MITTSDDTICAISTPVGTGGIAVIRISGPNAFEITDSIWEGKKLSEAASHTAHLGMIIDDRLPDKVLDQCVATVFRAPKSFTGEDVVELSVHGSRFIQHQMLDLLISKGCRLAERGEFTRRAFTSGKIDLTQAEAVADIIAAESVATHRMATQQLRGSFSKRIDALREQLIELSALLELELDFAEEDVEFASRSKLKQLAIKIHDEVSKLHSSFSTGNAIKNGIPVAIIGATNAGKSSLLNAILGDDRAIVSDIHGTTRDTIEDSITLGSNIYRFIDTAGLRKTEDKIEQLGIERSHKAIEKASIVVAVIDIAQSYESIIKDMSNLATELNGTNARIIVAFNKCDTLHNNLANENDGGKLCKELAKYALAQGYKEYIFISAKKHIGIDDIKDCITKYSDNIINDMQSDIIVTNVRHAEALSHAMSSTQRIINGLENNLSGDFIAQDVRETIYHLASITGAITTDGLLSHIFSHFCIGK